MSSSTEFLSNLKEAGQSIISTRRPWNQFFSSLSLPSSFSEATTRLTHNVTYFLFNYTCLFFLILFLSLIYHPFSVLGFLAVFVGWYFLYFARDEPLNLFNLVVLNDKAIVVGLCLVTVGALVMTNVWLNVVLSVVVGVVVVFLHGALRGTEDLVVDDHESPYGPMLSEAPAPYTLL